MPAPYRIATPAAAAPASRPAERPAPEFRFYLDRLLKLIPAEVVALYLVGSGLIPLEQPGAALGWTLFCLAGVIVVRAYGTSDPRRAVKPQWGAVAIAAVSFLIWVYSLGGPTARATGYIPWLGSLLVLAWTFVVPLVYRGDEAPTAS
jgi:hypothetical protein